MDEYISREAAIEDLSAEALERNLDSVMTDDAHKYHRAAERVIAGVPAADVVSRDAFNRLLAENDTMRAQLAQIGKKPGDSMSNVKWVAHGEWIGYPECLKYPNAYADDHIVCSVCEQCFSILDNCAEQFDFCPHCGADMREAHDGI